MVPGNQTRVPIRFDYDSESDPGPYPHVSTLTDFRYPPIWGEMDISSLIQDSHSGRTKPPGR